MIHIARGYREWCLDYGIEPQLVNQLLPLPQKDGISYIGDR
jgi:ABC-type antimicrobial peptide transport system ATPase subunit